MGGHGRELGAQGVPGARATEEARAPRDGAESGKATAPTITSAPVADFVLSDVSLNVRVRGAYAASVVCRPVVQVLILNSVFTFIPFPVPICGGGTKTYRVRVRISGHPFRQGDKEHIDDG